MPAETEFGKLPPALGAGSTLAVVSPASYVESSALEAGCRALGQMHDWSVKSSPLALLREGSFAGPPGSRAAALIEIWEREEVDAIICARGGYGSNYLLPLLDFERLLQKPKAFVGYSDNTSLLLALQRAGLVVFHGPMVVSDFATGRAAAESFRAALSGQPQEFRCAPGSAVRSLAPGEARGAITGGCLSIVVASLGTPWEIETRNRILFLEDVNEKVYRLDRMLMQLLLAGKFHGVRGVIFGSMLGCSAPADEANDGENLPEMLMRLLGGLGIPVALGFPSGHVESGNLTLPFGVPAVLKCGDDEVRLEVEPAACKPAPGEPGEKKPVKGIHLI
jgi:muramoyltetrapeptide carboxypeptidase